LSAKIEIKENEKIYDVKSATDIGDNALVLRTLLCSDSSATIW